ncbi:MAG: hypothetical protein QE271_10075, partial [Bacteriovoracaceae bacterium]|nr:hypothetical protein [Bacteriovoracaceae bacterium]
MAQKHFLGLEDLSLLKKNKIGTMQNQLNLFFHINLLGSYVLSINSIFALPILNLNVATTQKSYVMWPDNEDKNLFYFAPNFLKIGGRTNKYFGYLKTRIGGKRAVIITSLLKTEHYDATLEEAKDILLKENPKAKFASIPFIASRVEFNEDMKPFILSNDCNNVAGQAIDNVPCSFTLNKQGVRTFRDYWYEGGVTPFHFYYTISGIIKGATSADDKLSELEFAIVVNFGGKATKDNDSLRNPFFIDDFYYTH